MKQRQKKGFGNEVDFKEEVADGTKRAPNVSDLSRRLKDQQEKQEKKQERSGCGCF